MEDDKNECSRKLRLHYPILIAFIIISTLIHDVSADDAVIMAKIAKSFTKTPNGWSGSNPCKWSDIQCDGSGKVTSINLSGRSLSGEISSEVKQLSNLKLFNVQKNQLSGPLPPLSNMPALEEVHLDDNNFTSIPSEFLSGLPSLQEFSMDDNINLPPWTISDTLTESSSLVSFSADNARVSGPIPDIFGSFPSLQTLKLAYNNLTGSLPASLGKSGIQLFTLNNQLMGLEGSIDVIGSMKELNQVWLHVNQFTGPIPDLSGLESLFDIQLRDNQLTGVIPDSLGELPKLANITLQNNKFQGPFPSFPNNIKVSLGTTNGFCNTSPGPCDPRVTTLLEVASTLGYPFALADSWQGNDPCKGWDGIICSNGAITVINFAKRDFSGTISPSIAKISSLKSLILSDNKLYGTIPDELTDLPQLQLLDITNNNISGKIPSFSSKVILKTSGNKFIGKDVPITVPPGLPGSTSKSPGTNTTTDSVSTGVIVASVLAGIIFIVILCFVIYKYVNKKSKTKSFMKDSEKGKQEERTQSEYILSGTMSSDVPRQSQSSRSNSEVNQYDGSGGKNLIPMEVLREVTDNFSDDNILGRGGFGIVYKGQLHDGTMIAVKRMEASLVSSKGLSEFKAEIDVLTKVRHRHLVALHGFCENGNERLLVYEYMPQGTLSQHIFKNDETRGPPLTWKQRVTIALDVARGVEYLHTFAQQSFIHRDLKPSNVLLGDDMRAKVSDFGLVKSAPDGKYSVETKLAGTFGYLAPEYAATGRVTLKVDVYAFGVILMEIITGRKALDEKQPDDKAHLVTWFRRSLVNLEAIKEALDPNLKLDEETFESICKVVELAGHCTGREPHQRPDMGHVVSVLSPLVETWTPGRSDLENDEDSFGIDIHMSLPQAIQRWKANENTTDTYTFPSINVSKKFTDSTGSFSSSEAR